jgi:hypothetical protein
MRAYQGTPAHRLRTPVQPDGVVPGAAVALTMAGAGATPSVRHPFHSFAEDQGHRHDRADSALEREPVTSPAWIELGPGLEDDDELAGDYPRAK